jgi:hypothetical protein
MTMPPPYDSSGSASRAGRVARGARRVKAIIAMAMAIPIRRVSPREVKSRSRRCSGVGMAMTLGGYAADPF